MIHYYVISVVQKENFSQARLENLLSKVVVLCADLTSETGLLLKMETILYMCFVPENS